MGRKFLRYVIPSVLAMWIFSIYTMVNGIFVAKGVGATALAALNISMPYVNALFAVAILFAVGTSTIASINLGNKEEKEASEIFTMNMVILIGTGVVTTAIVLLNIERIAMFLGATSSTLKYVKDYLEIMTAFGVFTMMSYYFEVLVKTDGYPQLSTIVVLLSAVVNIFLVYLFVIKLGYGVKGAAFATGISQVVACLVYVLHFAREKSKIKFVRFKWDLSVLKKTIPLGLSDFITEFSAGFIIFMFNRIILVKIGEIGIITYTVIMFVNNVVLMTMSGISQGVQPLISYYYGRNDKKIYLGFLKMSVKTVAGLSLVTYVSCMIFSEQINGIFINRGNIEMFQYSVNAFRMYVSAYLIVGFNVVLVGFYAAIEKPLYSMIISTGRGLVIIAGSLFIMTELLGANGIWLSSAVAEAICLLIGGMILAKSFYVGQVVRSKSRTALR
jgi:putative MATE family efflux protein